MKTRYLFFYSHSEAASSQIHELYADVANGVYSGVPFVNNTNGTYLWEVFPNTLEPLSALLMRNVFGNINFDLFYDIAEDLYYELVTQNISLSYGSDTYFELYAKHTARWVDSGVYKQSVADAFQESGEHLIYNSSQSLEDFIDEVYDEFRFEDVYEQAFPYLYIPTYTALMTQGYAVLSSTDITRMTTNYMRYLVGLGLYGYLCRVCNFQAGTRVPASPRLTQKSKTCGKNKMETKFVETLSTHI